MTTFNINLIAGSVPPAGRRAALFWTGVAYLGACGLLLVVIAYRTTMAYVREAGALETMRRTERGMLSRLALPAGDPDAAVSSLAGELRGLRDSLSLVNGVLSRRSAPAAILAGLVQPLPAGMYLLNFELDDKKRTVGFDLVAPGGASTAAPNAGELIAHWNENPVLAGELSGIRSLVSERQRIDNRPVFLLKFEARLEKRWVR